MAFIERETPGAGDAAQIAELQRLLAAQRRAFLAEPMPSLAQRLALLGTLANMLLANRTRIQEAIASDFGSHPRQFADLVECLGVAGRAQYAAEHLVSWMKPQARALDPALYGSANAYVQPQPKGVIGNMAPWNFPFDIGLGPVVEMLAAGNRVIVKPSDLAPACSELLLEIPIPDGLPKTALREISRAGERAAGLTRQLLAFGRRQMTTPRVLCLNEVITDVDTMFRRLIGEDIELSAELDPDLGTVFADPSQLEQVLMNLVVNARDAMPQGGCITIGTGNVQLGVSAPVGLSELPPGPYVALRVTDTGCAARGEGEVHRDRTVQWRRHARDHHQTSSFGPPPVAVHDAHRRAITNLVRSSSRGSHRAGR